jgi:hypothetical protein
MDTYKIAANDGINIGMGNAKRDGKCFKLTHQRDNLVCCQISCTEDYFRRVVDFNLLFYLLQEYFRGLYC